jgi:hypothetical protein
VTDQQYAEHLAGLEPAELARLLAVRPDTLLEPAPGNFLQLAQRLSAAGSVSAALWELTASLAMLARAVVALGSSATRDALGRILDATHEHVEQEILSLCRLGLAWRDDGGVVHLVPPFRQQLTSRLGGSGPFRELAQYIRVPELQQAARAFGLDPIGKKAVLVDLVQQVIGDRVRIAQRVDRLADDEKDALARFLAGDDPTLLYALSFGPASRDKNAPLQRLRHAGLIFLSDSHTVVPDEVAEAFYLLTTDFQLPEAPLIPDAGASEEQVRTAARSSAEHALRAVTSLMDDAAVTPIAVLKKGGVGARERSRIARRLALPDTELPLWLDLASSARLMSYSDKGYGPSAAYAAWREATPARQWAALALGWLNLDHTPTRRTEESSMDTAPPQPIVTGGGAVRRRLLPAALPNHSVTAVGRAMTWFCAMTPAQDPDLPSAIIREAELLGVVALDSVSELGRQLLSVRPIRSAPRQVNMRPDRLGYDESAADELAAYCSDLLGDAESRLVLQSDLTAIVSGRPSPGVARLLRAAAVPETRGTAETWRFSPASIREAMDAGWIAEELLASLRQAAAHDLPHSLSQLIDDVARRHGEVRVREVRSCLVAGEPLATEIRHTRSLAKLSLSQPAPTVLVSPETPEVVLPALRAAGFLPVSENADGVIVVPSQAAARAPAETEPIPRARRKLTPEELVARLHNPTVTARSTAPTSATYTQLAELNPLLNEAEIALLADAVDSGGDVVISYSDVNGSVTTRQIQPLMLFDRWLGAFCRLRKDERHFAVSNIQAVSPVA